MITSINEFRDYLNENLLIPRRSKEERNIKLLQNNYRKLCDTEVIDLNSFMYIDSAYDFPSTFDLSKIKLKTINGTVCIKLNHIPLWLKNVTVNGNFYCYYIDLTTLEGCPSVVNGGFYCHQNKLTSLVGAPITINGSFGCANNWLTSLEGCPTTIEGDFSCSYNRLTSLEGCPKIVKGMFDCRHNSKQFSLSDVYKLCKVNNVDL